MDGQIGFASARQSGGGAAAGPGGDSVEAAADGDRPPNSGARAASFERLAPGAGPAEPLPQAASPGVITIDLDEARAATPAPARGRIDLRESLRKAHRVGVQLRDGWRRGRAGAAGVIRAARDSRVGGAALAASKAGVKTVLSAARKLRDRPQEPAMTDPSDLGDLLGPGAEAGEHRAERSLLLNVVALKTLRVDDVMVPRADIVAIELSASLEETLEAFRAGQHSRLPVYRDTLDDVVGVVHLKDLALAYGFGAQARDVSGDFALANHLRSILAAPPSMRVQALLQRMQATRRHMALVIDEYGGVDGLVTIEDILEQIVGEIEDEHDDAERPLWVRQADGCYMADARAVIEDFQEAIGRRLLLADWEEEIDTIGGLIFMLSGRVPERGEVITHPSGVEFEILDADPRRIKRVRVRPGAAAGDAPEAEPGAKSAAASAAPKTIALGAAAGSTGADQATADGFDEAAAGDQSDPSAPSLDGRSVASLKAAETEAAETEAVEPNIEAADAARGQTDVDLAEDAKSERGASERVASDREAVEREPRQGASSDESASNSGSCDGASSEADQSDEGGAGRRPA